MADDALANVVWIEQPPETNDEVEVEVDSDIFVEEYTPKEDKLESNEKKTAVNISETNGSDDASKVKVEDEEEEIDIEVHPFDASNQVHADSILENGAAVADEKPIEPNHSSSSEDTIKEQPRAQSPILQDSLNNEPKEASNDVETIKEQPRAQSPILQDSLNNESKEASNDVETIKEQPRAQSPILQDSLNNESKESTNDVETTLEEYEQKLRKNITEALELVNELCTQNTAPTSEKAEVQLVRQEFAEGLMLDADSYKLNPDLMKEPTFCVVLPENRIFIGDDQLGLLVFNLQTKELKTAENTNKWRRPKSAVYVPSTQHIWVLMEYSAEENDTFDYFICRFTPQLEYVNRIEAPRFIKEKEIVSFKICYANQTNNLYLAANTTSNAFLYELTPEGKWTEVYNSRGRNFVDVQVFAVIDPITELLILESTSYARLISIYGSDTVDKRMVAVCEKPGAMCLDEAGNLFIFDRATSRVAQHSRMDFLKMLDIAVFDRAHCQISAASGILAVFNCQLRDLRLYKY